MGSPQRPTVLPEDALVRAALALASELSLPAVLAKIIELACDVSGARYGALGVVGPTGGIDEFVTHGITDEQRARIGRLPQGKGILGALIDDGRPLRLTRIQDDPRSVGFPANHPPMTTFLGVPLIIRGRTFGNLYLTEKRGGGPFTADDQDAVERLAAHAAVAVQNARLFTEAEDARRRLEAVHEVTAAILAGEDRDDVLHLVATRARDLVGAALATIVVPAGAGELIVRIAVGDRADELRGIRFAAEGSASADVMQLRSPLLVPDASADPRLGQPLMSIGGIGPMLMVPLAAGDTVFGTLAVANVRGGAGFGDDYRALMQTFAAQAAVAIDYASIRSELARLALVDERERIAKELHDDIIQSLFAEGMSLQALESSVKDDAIRSRLSQSVDNIDRVIRDLRGYIFGLRPGAAADRQLDVTLRALAESFGKGSSAVIDVRTHPEAVSRLAGKAADLVSFVREALSNAVRHAHATRIDVLLEPSAHGWTLQVSDDGRGFDVATARGSGHGLGNLSERAERIGGAVQIESSPGKGTTVRLHIPV